jgi:hypothetical protein
MSEMSEMPEGSEMPAMSVISVRTEMPEQKVAQTGRKTATRQTENSP